MLTYMDIETFLRAGLLGLGYTEEVPNVGQPQTLPLFDHGPYSETKAKQSPGSIIFAEVGGGAGLMLEHTYDQIFVTLRVLGPSGEYDQTERLAYDLDRLMNQVDSARFIGSTRVLWIVRTGGAPQLVGFDDADRYHFQATYITPAMTGL